MMAAVPLPPAAATRPTGLPPATGPAAAPVLSVQGLCLQATGSGERVLDDLSLDLRAGEFLALVGESGSGKTLAARALMGLLPPGIARTQGRIVVGGQDLAQADASTWRGLRGPTLGMVFQEPMVSLNPAQRIGVQMEEGLKLHTRLNAGERRARCLDLLRQVQIADPERCLSAWPHEFSGGMRQRIMLASVMLLQPQVLIADEPTTALDTLSQREVLDLMVRLARDHGTSVLLITHNLGLVARYAQRAVVLRRGRVVESGDALQVLQAPQSDYTRALVDALPQRGTAPPRAPSNIEPVIEAKGLQVAYADSRQPWFARRRHRMVVHALDLKIQPGEMVAVVGGSGSGKTTLGRALLRLLPAAGGELRFRGRDLAAAGSAALRDFRLACQLVFQDPYSSLDPRQTVAAIVGEPLRLLPELTPGAAARRVSEVLEEVGLDGLQRRLPHELSGGQRQRVAIARAIVRRPAFVVADEPVAALDMTIQAQVLRLFQQLQRQHGFACLFISHDLAAVGQIADRVIVMQDGRIVEQGERDAVLDAPQHPYTRALLDAATPLRPAADRPPRSPAA